MSMLCNESFLHNSCNIPSQQAVKVFLYGTKNCSATYANTISNYNGSDSFRDDERPCQDEGQSLEDSYEETWVQKAAIAASKVKRLNVEANGFPNYDSFHKWATASPVTCHKVE